jgi:predicted DNA-binding protein
MAQALTRTDSYLLRLSKEERRQLEFISRESGREISEVLRDLIEREAERLEKSATK